MGRALMSNPRLLLLDEPSMGLSPLLVSEIFDIIESISKQGVTILLVEQNAKKALSIADRGYVLETGNIVMEDSAQALQMFIRDRDNFFQICFAEPNQGVASADYIADQQLGTKIAVIYRNDDVYSSGIYEKFQEEASAKGLEIVSATTFTDASSNDFSVQLTEARDAGADLVFLPIYYQPASLILKQASDMGYTPKFFGVDGMDGILTLEGFDTSLAEGVMLLTPFNADATDDKTVS